MSLFASSIVNICGPTAKRAAVRCRGPGRAGAPLGSGGWDLRQAASAVSADLYRSSGAPRPLAVIHVGACTLLTARYPAPQRSNGPGSSARHPPAPQAAVDPQSPQRRHYRRAQRPCCPHTWRTRPDPFAAVWEEIQAQLVQTPEITAKALLHDLQTKYPGHYTQGQLRTLLPPSAPFLLLRDRTGTKTQDNHRRGPLP